MLFVQRQPAPPLDSAVESIWLFEQRGRPHALERVLPTGAAQLIVNLAEDATRVYDPDRGLACIEGSGTILTGPSSRYQVIDTREQEYVGGVVFKPGGTGAFTRTPAAETADLDVALDDLWGRRLGAALRERILDADDVDGKLAAIERFLLEQWRPRGIHPAVDFALSRFARAPHLGSISQVTDVIGLSPKRFIEHFRRDVGLTPKRYCRVLRFQSAVARAHHQAAVHWTQVAADCGYFDQSHFIHDFRAFAGVTPTAYETARTAFANHVRLED